MDVTIEKLVYGGDGLSRVDGTVVFTPYVLPGERVRAEVAREKPGLVWTRRAEVLAPSPSQAVKIHGRLIGSVPKVKPPNRPIVCGVPE